MTKRQAYPSTRRFRARLGMLLCAAVGVTLTAPLPGFGPSGALGQAPAPEKKDDKKLEPVLGDFVHYVLIYKFDLAASKGQELIKSGIKPTEFVDLVEKSRDSDRFAEALGRAMRHAESEATAAELLTLYETGKRERVRDPKEIAKNIALLTGLQRNRMYATERLVSAGEYAMPQLLEALMQMQNPDLSIQARAVMIDPRMGRAPIIPLCTALLKLDPVSQEKVVDILGLIPYRTSLPFLYDLRASTQSPQVQAACDRATDRLGGPQLFTREPAALYGELAQGYYDQRPELTSFPGEAFQLLWEFSPAVGLTMTAIRTPVYHEAMSMRYAERSLDLKPAGNEQVVSLWLASNLTREIDTEIMQAALGMKEAYQNPAYPATRRDAMYYAVAAGAGPCEGVLARAIDDRRTTLARRAIAAIDETAGGSTLWQGAGGRRPLLESLRYPNRRVQFEAALALAQAGPTQSFDGSERVVPILASAIRDAGTRYAVVIATDNELYQSIRKVVEKGGYRVLPFGRQLSDLAEPIAETPGIDLVVSSLPKDSTAALIAEVRSSARMLATPILALLSAEGTLDLSAEYGRDQTVMLRASGISEEMMSQAIAALVESASGGPISEEEARGYSAQALAALRDLAVSGNAVLDVGDAALPLSGALGEATGKTKMDIAEVLARIGQKRVQMTLMDAALASSGEERVALLGKTADSAKRFGNMLDERQVQRVVEMTRSSQGAEATAAAALMGALNLPNTDLVPLILGKSG